MPERIVLATMGSLGDLHPFIAIARQLQQHGHEAIVATHPDFRANVTAEGVAFHPVRPSTQDVLRDLKMDLAELGRRIIADTMFVLEGACFPYLEVTYDDLLPVIEGSSLVLSSVLMFSARLAAEKLNIPHMTVSLQPMAFMSMYDPPAMGPAPWLAPLLLKLGPTATRAVYGTAKKLAGPKARPVMEFRRALGLPQSKLNPLFEGQFAALGTFSMYSPLLGAVQPDYPPNTTLAGYTFHDHLGEQRTALPADLQAFLAVGAPPVVFTLGSFAVNFAGDFYGVSLEAARKIGRRAILLVGAGGLEKYGRERSSDVFVCDYAPYSDLFPHAVAIVHHGGIGTVGQGLRSGRPQLIVPFIGDQFDNAARIVRLGVGRTLALKRYAPERVAAELSALLDNASYAERAASAGMEVRREDGAEVVARAVDAFLKNR